MVYYDIKYFTHIHIGGNIMNRKKSRELAMKALYQVTINNVSSEQALENIKILNEEEELAIDDEIDFKYISTIISGVMANEEEIDGKINENLKNWKLNRVSKVNLCILRLSIYEILYMEDIPKVVSVNEAIELSKTFSEEKAPKFINGVLANLL